MKRKEFEKIIDNNYIDSSKMYYGAIILSAIDKLFKKEECAKVKEHYQLKWGIDKTINMGRALGVGFCYIKLSIKSEIYLYINLWKYNITIGRFVHNI